MEVAKIFVGSTSGIARNRKRIPSGKTVSGLTVSVEFTDPVWEDMIKTVVFRGTDSRIAEFDGKTAVIPWEVLTEPGVRIWFGIFGHNPDTGMQLPLIEVDIGVTERATDPLADPGTDPTLPIWAQLQQEIEQLKQAGVSEEKIAQIVADYLTKNPPTVSETDPTVPDWAKNKEKPEYTAQEVGALSQDALDEAVNDALAKAKESGEFDGKDGAPGQDYVLTDADRNKIAEMAAELVDVPDSAGFVVQDTEPEDTSVLWVDPTDNSEDGFQEAVNAALAQAKESGEFDGPPGQPGKDGKDGVVAVTGATVGQTVKISAVDENGVPTAWEPTDFPSGGGSEEYEYIGEFNVGDSDVERWDITEDANGKPIRLKEIYFEWLMQPSAATTSNTDLLFGNPLIEMPFATNVAFYKSQALRTSVNSRYGGNGVHAKHYPSGIYSSGEIRSMIIAFEHSAVFAIRWTIGREDSPRGSECIGGLAMKTANASTGLIGAGSTVKIWGVRM